MIENGKHDITDALVSLQPKGIWAMTDISDYSTLTWSTSEIPIPTEEECNAEIARLDQLYIDKEYQRKRAYLSETHYLQIEEQLDQLYHDIESGKFGEQAKSGDWYVGITSVKNANPKPS